MTRYVLCFLFNRSRTAVVLLQKRRPEWQSGKLNGPGGKIEGGEPASDAASREMLEETGLAVPPAAWRQFATLRFDGAEVACFEARHPDECPGVRATTDEIPTLAHMSALTHLNLVENVHLLVHLANAGLKPAVLEKAEW